MEPPFEYSMYFPAAPITGLPDPAEYSSLPRRKHIYLGETVQFLLVLRYQDSVLTDGGSGELRRRNQAGSLRAAVAVYAAETRSHRAEDRADSPGSCGEEEVDDCEPETADNRGGSGRNFRLCSPVHLRGSSGSGGRTPVESTLVLDEQVIFCLTVSLDNLPADTVKAKVVVTVWRQEEEKLEVREHGYLTLLQLCRPTHTFKQDLNILTSQVSTTLNVLPPPRVECQQLTVCGKHLTVLKVLNCSSQEDVCVRDVKILPNYNLSYLPMMPDGSVLIVDNVCHRSAEVTMSSFCRLDSESSRLPSVLSAWEEQSFLFQLQLQEQPEDESSEGLEVPLVAVLQWYTTSFPHTRSISTCYSLPSVRLDRPRLVMTASCPRAVRPLELFWVKYTLLNNLQDFLSVRLVWKHEDGAKDPNVRAVVCRTPSNHLGRCRKGSSISVTVAFQILQTGLFELNQHMKMKLQFTASTPPMEPRSPSSSSSSPCRPAVRELLGRSQSFSHQQTSRFHHVRTGSVMERPVHLPPEHSLVSLDKIAKRECEVLVLEPGR